MLWRLVARRGALRRLVAVLVVTAAPAELEVFPGVVCTALRPALRDPAADRVGADDRRDQDPRPPRAERGRRRGRDRDRDRREQRDHELARQEERLRLAAEAP